VTISAEISRRMTMSLRHSLMYRIAHEAYDPHASFSSQFEFTLTDRGLCYKYPLLETCILVICSILCHELHKHVLMFLLWNIFSILF